MRKDQFVATEKALADTREELAAERKRVQKLTEQLDAIKLCGTVENVVMAANAQLDQLRAENLSLRAELDQARGELQDALARVGDGLP